MPYLRFTRDRRGYENTFLMHAAYPGERPRILYWYRTAPGVRVGRPALDAEAIRTIEAAHPEILFDWAEILELGTMAQLEVEAPAPPGRHRRPPRSRQERPARRASRPPAGRPAGAEAERAELPADAPEERLPAASAAGAAGQAVDREEHRLPVGGPDQPTAGAGLLEELVGRGIATRVRGRYAELRAHIEAHPADEATKERWRLTLETINPDAWVTAEDVLAGMTRADAVYAALHREIAAGPPRGTPA